MNLKNSLIQFYAKNKVSFLSVFLMNGVMLWFSYMRFQGAPVLEREGFHNLVVLGNFIAGLWICFQMNWKMIDYKMMVSPANPDLAKPAHLILAMGMVLFVSCINLYLYLPFFSWLESGGQVAVWASKFTCSFICTCCFIQIFSAGWAMNLENRDQFEKNPDHNIVLNVFRSFIDFYFYYMALACTGILLYKLFGDSISNAFPHFRLLDVVFCVLAADLMVMKAIYELKSKKAFLWSSGSSWSVDLPAGIIKVLTVSLIAMVVPVPGQKGDASMAESKAVPVKQERSIASDLPMVEDPELKLHGRDWAEAKKPVDQKRR